MFLSSVRVIDNRENKSGSTVVKGANNAVASVREEVSETHQETAAHPA
jgi:hypothetical protein